jgi:glycerophosphoryl diester phosphodiesterase
MSSHPNSGAFTESMQSKSILANGLWDRRPMRVGHGGAAGSAPANTLKSLATAIEIGVDMVEFDVRPCLDSLVLLHDDSLSKLPGANGYASQTSLDALKRLDAGEGEPIATLEEALDFVKGKALMNIDLKSQGIEAGVVQTVAEMGVGADVLISSQYPKSLKSVRELAPDLRIALSYPRDRGNVSTRPALQPAVSAILKLLRLMLPYQIVGKMEAAAADVAMLHVSMISPQTVRKVHQAKGTVFAWTVDDLPTIHRLRALGVDGITSNYPELFKELG